MSNNSINVLIKEISEINKIIKDNKITSEINLDCTIKDILDKEKEYSIVKYNLNKCNNNLQENLKLLKQKCDIEFKIYEILIDHKIKLDNLQKKHNIEIPPIDKSIQKLFSLNLEDNPKINNPNKDMSKKLDAQEKPKLNANILQDQLNAAILSRRNAINPE